MLTKLIGYEMRAFGRIMLPLYAATVGLALLIGLGVRFLPENSYTSLLGIVVIMLFSALVIATMVMTAVLCVQRFYQNLLANEGYLMFSLPVGTHQLILSKVLASLIWTLLGGVAALCTVAAMGLGAVSLREIADALRRFHLFIDMQSLGRNLGTFAVWAVIAVLIFVAFLMQIYAALAVGHQWTAHRILGAVVAYYCFNLATTVVRWALANIGVHTGMMGALVMSAEDMIRSPGTVQALAAGSAAVSILVYSLVTWYFLDRRLNLE